MTTHAFRGEDAAAGTGNEAWGPMPGRINVPGTPSVIETGHRPSLDDRCDYNRNVPHAVTQ